MSRHANSGLLIQTGSGKLALWYHKDKPFECNDGKTRVFVTLLDEEFRPILDADGKAKPVLTNPATCRTIGFSD
ncbi:hypothetical protein GO755_38965 [Spirosoma sp. HMF4905]|uniref:Uncharacterized protein n=1 Tax=Spirosoma arboris TaxID=2682092 RepID=A0A7K1SQP2_9BACT|nr:hypothetical protein [Spirosoma arboris]MVM36060.1 hypothetical protein [Spirosoma arboris]